MFQKLFFNVSLDAAKAKIIQQQIQTSDISSLSACLTILRFLLAGNRLLSVFKLFSRHYNGPLVLNIILQSKKSLQVFLQ